MLAIKWLGWSGFKIKIPGKIIYFDPVIGEYDEPGDLVLISHSHADHSDLNILSRIRKTQTVVLTSKENQKTVNGIGMAPGDNYSQDSVSVSACDAYNIVRMREPGVPFHPKGFGVGWIVKADGKTIYHLGDTELIPEMSQIGPVDIMFLPISGYFVMDIDEAVKTVQLIRPKLVIPMHHGVIDVVFAGDEKPTHIELKPDPLEFANKLTGIADVRVLSPGETLTV